MMACCTVLYDWAEAALWGSMVRNSSWMWYRSKPHLHEALTSCYMVSFWLREFELRECEPSQRLTLMTALWSEFIMTSNLPKSLDVVTAKLAMESLYPLLGEKCLIWGACCRFDLQETSQQRRFIFNICCSNTTFPLFIFIFILIL